MLFCEVFIFIIKTLRLNVCGSVTFDEYCRLITVLTIYFSIKTRLYTEGGLKHKKIIAFEDLLKGASDMLNKAKEAIEETTGVDLDAIKDNVADKLEQAKDFVSDKVVDAKEFVSDKVEDASEFVSDKVEDVKEAVSNSGDLLEKAKGAVGGAKDAVVDKIRDLTDGDDDEKVA